MAKASSGSAKKGGRKATDAIPDALREAGRKAAELAQNPVEFVQNQIFGRPEADASAHPGLCEVAFGVRVPLEYRRREPHHHGAVRGQLDRMRVPQKQTATGSVLELSDVLADRRLPQVQAPGGGGEALGARDRQEAPQVNRIEHGSLLSRFGITVNVTIAFRNIRAFLTVEPC